MFLYYLEACFIISAMAIIISQWIIPIFRDQPLFPLFRKRELHKKIAEAEERILEAELERTVDEIDARVRKSRIKSVK